MNGILIIRSALLKIPLPSDGVGRAGTFCNKVPCVGPKGYPKGPKDPIIRYSVLG